MPPEAKETDYATYRRQVETAAEEALDALNREDHQEPEEAVEYAIMESQRFIMPGHALMTIYLSDQDPDMPDYCQRWQAYVGLSDGPTWSECVTEMARVCYYSDVMDRLKREIDS